MYINRGTAITAAIIMLVAGLIYYFCIPYKVNKGCTVVITTRKGKTYTYTARIEWIRILDYPHIFIYTPNKDDEDE